MPIELSRSQDIRMDPAQPPPQRSWQRTISYVALTFVCVLVAVEAVLHLGMFLMNGEAWEDEQNRLAGWALAPGDTGEVLHPYMGAAYDPNRDNDLDIHAIPVEPNHLGFGHPTSPLQKRSSERFLIGVTGGSVAWHLVYLGAATLESRLREHPLLQNREIEFVCLAFSGFKQPQQLMATNYVLALGGELDLLINLDGFNEVALGTGNYRRGMSPTYPRAWDSRAQQPHQPDQLDLAFRVWQVRAERQSSAIAIRDSWLRWLALRQVVWKIGDARRQSQYFQLQEEAMSRRQRTSKSFELVGPTFTFAADAEMYDHLVEVWMNASQQLDAVCQARQTIYLHFLQPNQYDPGSKRLTLEEREIAYVETSDYRPAVENGYPRLREAGKELQRRGVDFHDLSGLLQNVQESAYSDECCHFNGLGNELIAAAIADAVWERLDERYAD